MAIDLADAAYSGLVVQLRELLDGPRKSEIDSTSGWFDWTPLHAASVNGHLSCAELLLNAGATADCRDRLGLTPLHWATNKNHLSVVSALLAADAQVDLADGAGSTPLMSAARNGRSEIAKLLLDGGADRELKNDRGQTALDLVGHGSKDEIIVILREHERLERVVRPAVVAVLSPILPAELAEECGDFVHFPKKRRCKGF